MPEVIINPNVLNWIRQESGFSIKDIGYKFGKRGEEKLISWENGDSFPNSFQLRKLASIFKRSPAVFLLKNVPISSQKPVDYRSIQNTKISPNFLMVIRKAHTQRENAIELNSLLDNNNLLSFPKGYSIKNNPDKLSNEIRSWMNLQKILKTKKTEEFFKNAISLLESKGIMVTLFERIDSSVVRGFSIADKPFPIIGINSGDSIKGKIFTLFHELAHIFLNNSSICDMEENPLSEFNNQIEVWCNLFSASILCPENEFKEVIANSNILKNNITLEKLNFISESFYVSEEVIARRLFHFNYIDKEKYVELRNIIQDKIQKNILKKQNAKDLKIPYIYRILNQRGRLFTKLVLEAFHNKKISVMDTSDMLEIQTKHIEPLGYL